MDRLLTEFEEVFDESLSFSVFFPPLNLPNTPFIPINLFYRSVPVIHKFCSQLIGNLYRLKG